MSKHFFKISSVHFRKTEPWEYVLKQRIILNQQLVSSVALCCFFPHSVCQELNTCLFRYLFKKMLSGLDYVIIEKKRGRERKSNDKSSPIYFNDEYFTMTE